MPTFAEQRSKHYRLDRVLDVPLTVEQSCATAPERLGHGIEFDWDQFEAHRVH